MSTTTAAPKGSARIHVQKFGTFLSNMVMPNIAAFIAWGFITAIFIEAGWINLAANGTLPNDSWVAKIGGWGVDASTCAAKIMLPSGESQALADGLQHCSAYGGIVGPMITYLLPLLIAYTGGKMVYDVRGGVVGAIATMGVISGTSIPMFMGAMIMGPLGGWTMKKIDAIWDGKIRPGFEMLVNNFSAGIWGMILAIFGFFVMGPIVSGFSGILGAGVGWLVNYHLLPLTSVMIEPAKILFLNNAINHGILTPLGLARAADTGKSILFLLEANPGPGLGLLLAYSVFGKGSAKGSAPGAAIIHFFGGIHEIYFPYVLMRPVLVVAMIGGGASGVAVNQLFGTGLRAPAAPGSIIAIYAQTATDSYLGVTLAVLAAAAVTFLIAMVILKTAKGGDDDLAAATASMEQMKGKKSSVSASLLGDSGPGVAGGPIKSIVFACDAGMGSSAMGASVLRKKIQSAGFKDVSVVNKAISNLTDTFDLVVSHQDLTDRAKQGTPSAIHVSVDNFMASPRYDEVVELLQQTNGGGAPAAAPAPAAEPLPAAGAPASVGGMSAAVATQVAEVDEADAVLKLSSIVLEGSATDRDGAITEAGELLVASGNVDAGYVAAMHERERSVSTYMGNLLAIPHGTNEAKSMITKSSISVTRYPGGIDWNGNPVKFVIGIAGAGNDHLELLGKIAEVFLDEAQIAQLEQATTPAQVRDAFGKVNG
ncbi:MAG: PTS mannitol transporter subunit IICBA [Micropruina sp.]|uniref:PTS mannitol transporter subunit IICBA n=1 Tax=Micropruina sp. TaxID=2737536 RepID=UPI0039E6E707